MEFGSTISNPLLQIAVSANEAVIYHASGMAGRLNVHVEMERSPEGRDAIHVFLESPDDTAEFSMLLRKYFDRYALWRVVRYAWGHRISRDAAGNRLHPPVDAVLN